MKKTLVIHTGGTISMKENPDGSVVETDSHPLSNADLLKTHSIEEENVFHLPSPHITPPHMLTLANYIKEKASNGTYAGIVVTHGTDTLEETAYFVDLCVNTTVPIVFTGAMRSSNEIGSDGLYNLICAIRVASHHKSKQRGVLVVMNDEIHTAQYVTKTSTSNVATFQSPQFGPVGMVTKQDVYYYQKTYHEEIFDISAVSKNVLLLKAYAGMPKELIEMLDPAKTDGLIIEGLGQGNVPPTIVPAIQHLLQHNVVVLLVSRCYKGIVQPTYQYEGGGRTLVDKGVIFANHLNGPKARLKLMLLLENHASHHEMIHAFKD
ncbi:asparaginase [Gracilibacillus caseinilyticus]|uniref:asparaginase n=1 Tax=Gracilibacillus caseinilyticus TaxID=2932256 RepID=A0ABY4ET10_9BACI|nr:asparaginase [Gracilibacillus caseinilyticus]UOQ47557.1 asparaginase [Gracilibacillus caseinilyticus]